MELEAKLSRGLSGVCLGIGLLVLLNELQIPFYLYYPHVTHTILISESDDLYFFLASSVCVPSTFAILKSKLSRSVLIGILAIWVASLALTILGQSYGATILYATVVFGVVLDVLKADLRRLAFTEVLTPALGIFVLIESSSMYYWISAALNPLTRVGIASEQVELNLTFSLFPVAVVMMLLLLLSWVPLTVRLPRKTRVIRYEPSATSQWKVGLIAASIDLFAILALLIFFYPYLAGQTWIVGVDSYWRYLNPLNALAGLTPYEAVATSSTHGLYLAFLYLIEIATGASAFSIVKFAPLVLAFATATAVFLVLSRGSGNRELAAIAAICSLLWFPTTLGIYAGIQTNFLAYFLWMLFLSFYFYSKKWDARTFVIEGLVSLAILVVHPWTWGIFVASLALAVPISWRTRWRERAIRGVLATLVIALPVGAGTYAALPSLRSDLVSTMGSYVSPIVQPGGLLSFGGAMEELFANWTPFLPPLLLLVCLIGVYGLSRSEGVMRNYLVAWIAAWFIGSILIAPSGYTPTNVGASETGLWRMIYVSPLPILLALGLQECVHVSRYWEGPAISKDSSRFSFFVAILLIAVSAGLFITDNPLAKALIVVGVVVAIIVASARFPNHRLTRTLLVSFLALLLINAAFRSLYPLLLDPHSLLGPIGAQ